MYNISKKLVLILFLCLLVISMVSPNSSNAARLIAVMGLIENVSDDSIVVLDRRYMITGVPLIKLSGELASKDELKIDTKVTIYFVDKNITRIMVHPDMPK
jgi:hypothetical protein